MKDANIKNHALRSNLPYIGAAEVAMLYQRLISHQSDSEDTIIPIIAVMCNPRLVGQTKVASKEGPICSVRNYARRTVDMRERYQIRNDEFFAKGRYLEHLPEQEIISAEKIIIQSKRR